MAAMLSLEVTMFNAAVFLMGMIGAASLAAHSIAIQLASLTVMVPLGIGQAVTVRVGRAYGARDRETIRRAGWTAFWLAMVFMATMSLMMIVAPRLLISAFLDITDSKNAGVIDLVHLAGCSDSVRVGHEREHPAARHDPKRFGPSAGCNSRIVSDLRCVVPNCRRGPGRGLQYAARVARCAYADDLRPGWILGIGLPLAASLTFLFGLDGIGIWIRLSTGLTVVACLMVGRWRRREALGLLLLPDA
jgi:MATE family multidrug resistance protein